MEVLNINYIILCKYNKTLNNDVPSTNKHNLCLYAAWYPK